MAIWAGTREGMDDVVKGNFVDCVEAGGGFRDADGAAEEFGGEVGETDVSENGGILILLLSPFFMAGLST